MGLYFKAFSHKRGKTKGTLPTECREIALEATPEVLREIAKFINHAASVLEAKPVDEEAHMHFQDQWESWSEKFPDIVVVAHRS